MTLKVFLSIIAVLGIVHGIAFIVAPYQVASFYGLQQSMAVALVSRFFGGALIAWGAILWLAKTFRDEGAVRAVLISTGIAEAISVCVAVMGILAGTMNMMGWVTVLIYLFVLSGVGTSSSGRRDYQRVFEPPATVKRLLANFHHIRSGLEKAARHLKTSTQSKRGKPKPARPFCCYCWSAPVSLWRPWRHLVCVL